MASSDLSREAALAVLGLPAGASRSQIGHAYRQLARATHPDLCADSDAGERFLAVSAAYRRAISADDRPVVGLVPVVDLPPVVDLLPVAELLRLVEPVETTPSTRVSRSPLLGDPPVEFAAGPVQVHPWRWG